VETDPGETKASGKTGPAKGGEDGKTESEERARAVAEARAVDEEQRDRERFEIGRNSNFLLGSNILEKREEQSSYWVVDGFSGWQSIREGEGARYSFVGVNALLEMHRGRVHFVLAYVLPLIFIVLVSVANFFFDVRDLEPRLSIASGLLLCMVAFQYTIEQEIPKVSYPVWINWYLVGCYTFIVGQVLVMVVTLTIAGRRTASNNRWTRKALSEGVDDIRNPVNVVSIYGAPGAGGAASDRAEQLRRESLSEWFNSVVTWCYPALFLVFNLAMFLSIPDL
jgi:hypothetical protein